MANLHKKRIMFLLPAMMAGGGEGFTVEAATAVVRAGGVALVGSSGGGMVTQLTAVGAHHCFVPFRWPRGHNGMIDGKRMSLRQWLTVLLARICPPLLWWWLYKIVKAEKIDLLYASSRTPAWYGWLVARYLDIPFITGFHGIYSGHDFWPKKIYNSIMVRGDKIHAVSFFIQHHIESIYRIRRDKIAVIYGGVALPFFRVGGYDNASQQAVAAMTKNALLYLTHYHQPRVIFMPGRLAEWKAPDLLLSAFASLLHERDDDHRLRDVVLLFQDIGKRSAYQKLQEMIKKQRLVGRVGFLPQLSAPQLLAAYDQARVVVNASRRPEPFGRTVVEAMARKKMVIAPNHGAAVEQVNDGVNGFLFVAGDDLSLRRTLTRALALTDKQANSIGQAAQQTVRDKFYLPDKQDALVALFAATIDGYDR